MNNFVHERATMGTDVSIGHFSVIEDGVVLGDRVTIGNNVTIHAGTILGNDVFISDNCVVGRWPRPAKASTVKVDASLPALVIGDGTTLGANTVLYRGSSFGKECMVGDQASVREKCEIGDRVVIGRGVAVENQVSIGSFTKIQTNSYITAYTTIEERVFIAPTVTTTNDNFMGRTKERFQFVKGAHIKKGARIGGASILLPGVVVAEESFIAAGAVVHRDTEEKKVYVGVPARVLRDVPVRELLENQE
ncbi:transferase hexapeptide (six repeat-containing protein) [Thermoactinomyces sp. DSM 45891]|uniref:N-acetyltransferase n=1 Tax=Thermoactinomyces sp. DSM 45891 TaxID=1761907 RepID=UPI00090F79E3|nr:acyltransferase [Thermoactinomyces sp. DSM 45891]SFX23599.1 transferase hexapeptide (six repeat-containing protein) [Thermoactinomyces sp. DSM 45891]